MWNRKYCSAVLIAAFNLFPWTGKLFASCEEALLARYKLNHGRPGEKQKAAVSYCQLQSMSKMGLKTESVKGRDFAHDLKGWNPCQEEVGPFESTLNCDEESLEEFMAKIGTVYDDENLACLFKHSLKNSLAAATGKLKQSVDEGTYTYGSGGCSERYAILPEEEWALNSKLIAQFFLSKTYAHSFRPRGNCPPSMAMACFTEKKCSTECAVGQMVVQYSMMREFMGDADFDKFFKGKVDLTNYDTLRRVDTTNPWWSQEGHNNARTTYTERMDRISGPALMIGLSGGLGSPQPFTEQVKKTYSSRRGGAKVDDSHANENFVITSFSDKALLGWKHENINDTLIKAWMMQKVADRFAAEGKAAAQAEITFEEYERPYLEKFLQHPGLQKDAPKLRVPKKGPVSLSVTAAQMENISSELAALRQNPALTEVKLYVHPFGEMTLLQYVDAMKGINPDLSYQFGFYPDITNGLLFNQLKGYYFGKCMENLITEHK